MCPRTEQRESQKHGEKRLVLRDFHERTHNHDGSLKTKHPTVLELLARFPAEVKHRVHTGSGFVRRGLRERKGTRMHD